MKFATDRENGRNMLSRLYRNFLRLRAHSLRKSVVLLSDWSVFRVRHRHIFELTVWTVTLLLSASALPFLESMLNPILDLDLPGDIQDFLLTVGGAMIGATAISASFVLFAMQVNFERLPHGLFRRLSSDRPLLSAFALSFLMAIGITALSLVQDLAWFATALLAATWSIMIILRLLLFAYRRSLLLISPVEQLRLVRKEIHRDMRRWDQRARWIAPLLEAPKEDNGPAIGTAPDTARLSFFHANPHWTRELKGSIEQAASFARRAGEGGDLEISGIALTTLVALNADYIETKGRTFFNHSPFVDNPLVTDGVINETLEQLRRLCSVAVARGDEPAIEQLFSSFLVLTKVYLAIPYSGHPLSPTHAALAASYLQRAVESVVPHGYTDPLMEGIRNMAQAATLLLAAGYPSSITALVEKIGIIGCVGVKKPDQHPITLTAMEQLSALTLILLRADSRELHHPIGELRQTVSLLTKIFVAAVSDNSLLASSHSTCLGPYYSSTSMTSLRPAMMDLVNAVLGAPAGDETASRVARNLSAWADQLYESQQEILLLAVEKRSHFTFDMLHWITGIAELLLAASRADACPNDCRNDLERHARWLVGTLARIPRDPETVDFVENWAFFDALFELGTACIRREGDDLLRTTRGILLDWTFRGGERKRGWSTLQQGLLTLTTLALLEGNGEPQRLQAAVTQQLANVGAPSLETRNDVAGNLSRLAENLHDVGVASRAEHMLGLQDRAAAVALLTGLVEILSPPAGDGT